MHLTSIATEQTTAATDALLAGVSLLAAARLWQHRSAAPLRIWLWMGVFSGLALAAGCGALAHGLELDDLTRQWLWRPLNAALGLTVACIVAAAVLDRWGSAAARRCLPWLLALSAGFFVFATFVSEAFLAFIIYEGATMLFCLAVYGTLSARGCLPGAAWLFAGVLLSLAAAAIQTMHAISFTLVLPFNSNGAFHLVQLVALASFCGGLRGARVRSSGAALSADGLRASAFQQGVPVPKASAGLKVPVGMWMLGLLLTGAGCAAVQEHSLTYKLWDTQDLSKWSEPAGESARSLA
jgi:hypothetical protein